MAVDASLDVFRALTGARSTSDDAIMTWALEAATDVIKPQVYATHWNHSNVQYAVLMQANRWYHRRQSATGVEGFGPEGFAVRVMVVDPDIRTLLGPSIDMLNSGVG